MPFLFIISCIFLFNSVVYAAIDHSKVLKMKQSNFTNILDSLNCNYNSLFSNIDALSRACGLRLLTNDARLVNVQQNLHSILKLLFGTYDFLDHTFEDVEVYRSERLKAQGKYDVNTIEILNDRFIGYLEEYECLAMAKVVQNDEKSVRRLKYYPVKVQLPHVGFLYNKLIAKGINLNFVMRLMPRIINSYETSLEFQSFKTPILTNALNALVKEFIWRFCQGKLEKIERPSVSTMKHLAIELFKKSLNAEICTIKQGYQKQLCTHIIVKPCTVYDGTVFSIIGYPKDHIKNIERYKLPICPMVIQEELVDTIFYCIHVYNPNESNEIKFGHVKEYEQQTTMSLLKTIIPLMNVPEGTILSTYIVIPIKNLTSLSALSGEKQRNNSRKVKDKVQCIKGTLSSFSMITDHQLRIFMNHFANYIYTDANTDLIDTTGIMEILKMLNFRIS